MTVEQTIHGRNWDENGNFIFDIMPYEFRDEFGNLLNPDDYPQNEVIEENDNGLYITYTVLTDKNEIMSILTEDGKKSVEDGELSLMEVAEMYKYEQIRKFSKIGSFGDTFRANIKRVPQNIYEKLSPEEIAQLVDAFYKCYGDGKKS